MKLDDQTFSYNNDRTDMTMLDFWRWHYSDVYSQHDKIAEFIVAKALGKDAPDNVGNWALYDISYKGLRVEVKETAYYH